MFFCVSKCLILFCFILFTLEKSGRHALFNYLVHLLWFYFAWTFSAETLGAFRQCVVCHVCSRRYSPAYNWLINMLIYFLHDVFRFTESSFFSSVQCFLCCFMALCLKACSILCLECPPALLFLDNLHFPCAYTVSLFLPLWRYVHHMGLLLLVSPRALLEHISSNPEISCWHFFKAKIY